MSSKSRSSIPPVPAGTKVNGLRLWRDVLGAFELDEHETAVLREVVRCVDQLDELAAIVGRDGPIVAGEKGPKAHPALVESRQMRIVLARLLAALRLPEGEEAALSGQVRRRQRRTGARGVYGLPGGAAS